MMMKRFYFIQNKMFEDLHDNFIDYEFNPAKHISDPKVIQELKPFSFLTVRCVNILNTIIESHMHMMTSSERISHYIRGLGYHSSFIRDLCYAPTILELLKRLTGIDLVPHYIFSNVGHINIGMPNEKDVDQWHYDSVPYVLVILLSDPSSFQGGILEYEYESNIIPVIFSKAGEAFFMKGSEIKHHVTPLTHGRRLTLINSYMDMNALTDSTNLDTFKNDHHFEKEYRHYKRNEEAFKLDMTQKKPFSTERIIHIPRNH